MAEDTHIATRTGPNTMLLRAALAETRREPRNEREAAALLALGRQQLPSWQRPAPVRESSSRRARASWLARIFSF